MFRPSSQAVPYPSKTLHAVFRISLGRARPRVVQKRSNRIEEKVPVTAYLELRDHPADAACLSPPGSLSWSAGERLRAANDSRPTPPDHKAEEPRHVYDGWPGLCFVRMLELFLSPVLCFHYCKERSVLILFCLRLSRIILTGALHLWAPPRGHAKSSRSRIFRTTL